MKRQRKKKPYSKDVHKAASRAWLLVTSGRHAFPLYIKADMVDIRDIGHALSMQCRYGGHVRRFYSVGQHSTLMARHCFDPGLPLIDNRFVADRFIDGNWNITRNTLARMMQLHDASDPYFIDIPRPLKYQLYFKKDGKFVPVKEAEIPIERVVAEKYGLPYPFPDIVHEWDNRMLTTERNALLTYDPEWECPEVGLPVPIDYWLPEEAEFQFMKTFNELASGALV